MHTVIATCANGTSIFVFEWAGGKAWHLTWSFGVFLYSSNAPFSPHLFYRVWKYLLHWMWFTFSGAIRNIEFNCNINCGYWSQQRVCGLSCQGKFANDIGDLEMLWSPSIPSLLFSSSAYSALSQYCYQPCESPQRVYPFSYYLKVKPSTLWNKCDLLNLPVSLCLIQSILYSNTIPSVAECGSCVDTGTLGFFATSHSLQSGQERRKWRYVCE